MSWRDVPVPRRMNALQRDRRGYPVPFTVLRDSDGAPHFAVNDSDRTARCVSEKRCSICGSRIQKFYWLAGGPLSAFLPAGAYRDPAMHYECMVYALQVCPYLALPSYLGRVDIAGIDPAKVPAYTAFVDTTMLPERPPLFVAVCTRGIVNEAASEPLALIRAARPYIRVEFWRDGSLIPFATGSAIADAAVAAYRRTEVTK